jgi:hypothetical protein
MRNVLGALVLTAATVAAATTSAEIRSDALLDHIKFLASDEMKGRVDGGPELERAAEYIAQQFKAEGLQPGGDQGGWFQPFELQAGLTVGRNNSLKIEYRGKQIALTLGSSYYPLSAPANEDASIPSTKLQRLPVVFAGYGLSVPGVGYDDYAAVDVRDKAVLIFSHEPQEGDGNSRFNGARPVRESTLRAKASLARSKGARVLLVVSDPTHRTDDANYKLFAEDPDADDEGIPVLRIRRDEMRPLLNATGLEGLARLIEQDLSPRSKPLDGVTVDYEEHLAKNRRTVRNVVAVLPGSDPSRAKEAIVIGAHYDHIGIGGHLSVSPERTGEIHNGADDNASGTSSVIEIARAAAAERSRFPRTLVFVAFAGEERGLLGSRHYVEDPAIPLENTIAMLNLDMVGRSRGSVDVSGLENSPALDTDFQTASRAVPNLATKREGPGAGRSDDASFLDRGIPAINFFTGFHPDYHRPGDDWDKIDAAGTARVATLALEFASRIAQRAARPEFVRSK